MQLEFEQFKIKTYTLWDLYLHKNQSPYLGRAYAWARRENAQKITEMTKPEREELFDIVLPAWEHATKKLFHQDWTNFSILGNEAPHLHAHFIPRYYSPRNYGGIEFIDPNPKGNYAPYPKRELPLGILLHIKGTIQQNI